MDRTAVSVRFHGTGNAWPVPLGDEHPFYNRNDYRDLANAAYSLLTGDPSQPDCEILIDAGHGTIQSLLGTTNRVPEAICLTHGHLDHTLSVDWVVQSFYRGLAKKSKYPVYCTAPVFKTLLSTYPHLEEMLEHRNLPYGVPVVIGGTPFSVAAYPVYHGLRALGASMLLFTGQGKKILFTGDLLSPLLTADALGSLSGADLAICDSNNRFPYPRSNHWSVAAAPGNTTVDYLAVTIDKLGVDDLCAPHYPEEKQSREYLREFREGYKNDHQYFILSEFLQRIKPARAALVHYSGSEDEKYYKNPRLSKEALGAWLREQEEFGLLAGSFMVPSAGDILKV